eukprot:7320830-Prymnesium_polylepis.1
MAPGSSALKTVSPAASRSPAAGLCASRKPLREATPCPCRCTNGPRRRARRAPRRSRRVVRAPHAAVRCGGASWTAQLLLQHLDELVA